MTDRPSCIHSSFVAAMLASAVCVGTLQIGCGSMHATQPCTSEAPDWKDAIPNDEAYVYGVAGERSAGGEMRAREKVDLSVREVIAAKIQTTVERFAGRLLEDLEIGTEDDRFRGYVETVSRQVVTQTLRGSEVTEYWLDPCTERVWGLGRISRATFSAALKQSAIDELEPLGVSSERLRKALENVDRHQAEAEAAIR